MKAIIRRDNQTINRNRDYIEETSLFLRDILPVRPKHYDKNRAPKLQGQPTVVYFHVTVLSLDSINEESMVSIYDIGLMLSIWKSVLNYPKTFSASVIRALYGFNTAYQSYVFYGTPCILSWI